VKRRGGEIWFIEGILFIATRYHECFGDTLRIGRRNMKRIFTSQTVSFCFEKNILRNISRRWREELDRRARPDSNQRMERARRISFSSQSNQDAIN
jgi:hypothetical protein